MGHSSNLDLDFVHSDIDLGTLKPIEISKMVRATNEYLIRSSEIINKFCNKVQFNSSRIERNLNTFEDHLSLLEKKLQKLKKEDSLGEIQEKEKQCNIGSEDIIEPPVISLHHEDAHPQQEDSQDKMHDSDNCMLSSLPRSASPEKFQNTIEVRNHPKYSKYFKMLKMGIPELAVRQKMIVEGMDPALLDTPDNRIELTDI